MWYLLFFLLLALPGLAEQVDCTCPPTTGTTTTTTTTAPPMLGPGSENGDGGPQGPQGPETPEEEPVGDFNDWIKNNPESPLTNLVGQAGGDPGLQEVLNGLTPSELTNLGGLLTTYQTAINTYVQNNPRTWDTAGGGMRNFLNSLSSLAGNDPFVRGCADMSDKTQAALAPHTGGDKPFTVHGYNWTPSEARQYGAYFGTPVVMIMVVKGAGAGTCMAGPLGTVAGGTGGLIIALASGSTEHNMAALQSTRNPKLIIVLDPHAAQNGNPESVHGPGHYSGLTGSPTLGPARVPATPQATTPQPVDRGSIPK